MGDSRNIRRVTTGHDEAGRARVVADDEIEPTTVSLIAGFETFELWHTEHTPHMAADLGGPGVPDYFPSAGGTVLRIVTLPPDSDSAMEDGLDVEAAIAEAAEKLPTLMEALEPDNPGMHTTDTVDYGIMLEGELELELDDGGTTIVRPGTVVVQRGTRHAWHNRGDVAARIAFIQVGAHPAQ